MAGDPGVHGGGEPSHAGQAKKRREPAPALQVAQDLGFLDDLALHKRLVPVRNTRSVSKRDLLWNSSLPKIEVDPDTYTVKADGRELRCEPAVELPMAQRYFLF